MIVTAEDTGIAFPAKSYIEFPSAGDTEIVSSPSGKPVTEIHTLILSSPPDSEAPEMDVTFIRFAPVA